MNIFFIIIFFIFIYSCKPLIDYNIVGEKTIKENSEKTSNVSSDYDKDDNETDGTIILDVKMNKFKNIIISFRLVCSFYTILIK